MRTGKRELPRVAIEVVRGCPQPVGRLVHAEELINLLAIGHGRRHRRCAEKAPDKRGLREGAPGQQGHGGLPRQAGGPSWICSQLIKGGDEGDGSRVISGRCQSVSMEEPDLGRAAGRGCVCWVDPRFAHGCARLCQGSLEAAGTRMPCASSHVWIATSALSVSAQMRTLAATNVESDARPGDDDSGSLALAGVSAAPGREAVVLLRIPGWACARASVFGPSADSYAEPHHRRLEGPLLALGAVRSHLTQRLRR